MTSRTSAGQPRLDTNHAATTSTATGAMRRRPPSPRSDYANTSALLTILLEHSTATLVDDKRFRPLLTGAAH